MEAVVVVAAAAVVVSILPAAKVAPEVLWTETIRTNVYVVVIETLDRLEIYDNYSLTHSRRKNMIY